MPHEISRCAAHHDQRRDAFKKPDENIAEICKKRLVNARRDGIVAEIEKLSSENRPADRNNRPDDNRRRGDEHKSPEIIAVKTHRAVDQIACAERR